MDPKRRLLEHVDTLPFSLELKSVSTRDARGLKLRNWKVLKTSRCSPNAKKMTTPIFVEQGTQFFSTLHVLCCTTHQNCFQSLLLRWHFL